MPARNRLGSKAIATFRGTQEQQSKEYRSMKKFLTVAAIGAALALSGCGKSDDTAATSAGTVKREAGNRSEEHTSELQSLMRIPYAVYCSQKKTQKKKTTRN